jgi:hypothetical protein
MDSQKFKSLEVALANKKIAKDLIIDFKTSKDTDLSKILLLEKLESLTFRNFVNSSIIPGFIFEKKSIRSLHFNSCKFKKLPDTVSKLENLTELSIENCSFESISHEIFRLPDLKTLRLINQPSVNLEELNFDNENITTFEFKGHQELFFFLMNRLKAVQTVILKENDLLHFPMQILNFKNLISLDLSGNLLSAIPSAFSKIKNLENLDLSANKLTYLPDTFEGLKKLKNLNLADNTFKLFPNSLFQLKNLITLNFRNHNISSFSEDLLKLKKMKLLDLTSESFFSLPMNFSKWLDDESKELILNPVLTKIIESEFYLKSDKELKNEILQLFFTDYSILPRVRLKRISDLLKIKNFHIDHLAYKYMVDEPNLTISKTEKIYFFPDLNEGYKLIKSRIREAGYSVSDRLSKDVKYVVINHKIRFFDEIELLSQESRKFISLFNLILKTKDEAGFYLMDADNELDGIKVMLRAKSIDEDLLFILLETGAIPESLYPEIIVMCIANRFKSKSEKILNLLKLFARPGWDILLEKIAVFKFDLYKLKYFMNYAFFDINFDQLLNFRTYS